MSMRSEDRINHTDCGNQGKYWKQNNKPALPPNHPAAPSLQSKQWWADMNIPSVIAHTIYKSARMVLMNAVILISQKVTWIVPMVKYTVQQVCPFSMNAKCADDQLAAKLIVISAWRRTITMTVARRIVQHLLITTPFISLGVRVKMLLTNIYSTMWQRECQCICLTSVNINVLRH